MAGQPSPTWAMALVVVRDAVRFVLVNESRDRGWYLPAGRVDHGETLIAGARREVREEAGLEVELDGISGLIAPLALLTAEGAPYSPRLRAS